jgi:hypothetical protein
MVRPGDQFIVPAGFLRLSLDRDAATGQFIRYGISMFARMLYFEGLADDAAELDAVLDQYGRQYTHVFSTSEHLQDFDFDNNDSVDVKALAERIQGLESREYMPG